jgi:hypothetical protein
MMGRRVISAWISIGTCSITAIIVYIFEHVSMEAEVGTL